ncbi:MAG: rRNA cytosine-C5-methyltransferase [Nocardioidaceae bacterium]|nr:MAG: rRNA cytosine-C5-methyltransferase [Nocardioidaceae bacterium]
MTERRGRSRSGNRARHRAFQDPARDAAYEVITRVREDAAYTNLLLPAVLRRRELEPRDAAFATELAAGTIRGQGSYDAILAACVDRPLSKVDAAVLDALRMGTHQLLAMRVPTHAAVSTTVDLVRAVSNQGAAGFANAVLRKIAACDLETWIERLAPVDEIDRLALTTSHPAWVVELLQEAIGPAEIEALLASNNQRPAVTLAARPGLSTIEELPGESTNLSPYAVILDGGDPGLIPAVAQGLAGVQDEGSQLVAAALAQAEMSTDCGRWLDLCAGPGGKTALLAALAAQQGAKVLAAERQPHRASLVRSAVRAVPAGMLGVLATDGTCPPWENQMFDRVLVDAPCTGLGALRRRPEARWRRRPEDLAELVPLQRALLESAVASVRVGGVVAYATCSPVLAETAKIVTAVLEANPALALEDASPLFPTTDHAGPLSGTVQLWPHRHGTDAMFFALIRRVH